MSCCVNIAITLIAYSPIGYIGSFLHELCSTFSRTFCILVEGHSQRRVLLESKAHLFSSSFVVEMAVPTSGK